MKFIAVFATLLLVSCAIAQTKVKANDEPPIQVSTSAQLETFMDSAIERGLFRGAIIVVESGKVIFERPAGDAETDIRATTVDSSFYLASISKQFTATAIMLLQEQGALSYDDLLSDHLPELPGWARTITIRHMLTHTSGLGNFLDADLSRDGLTNDAVVAYLTTLDGLEFTPGDKYGYSNSGYLLLAQIVERVTGMSFRAFTTTHIFEPLGMTGALFNDDTRPAIPDRVLGYDRYGFSSNTPMLTNGAGGMFASARDLVRWHQAIFDSALLQPETLDNAFTQTTLNDGSVSDYGFGWHVANTENGKALHHTGSLAGYRHFVFVDLASKHVVIMLTNGGDSFPLPGMATAITNIVRGRPAITPKAALIDYLYAFAKANPDGLRAETTRVRKEEPDRFRISGDELNELGYAFLGMNQLEEATGVFEAAIDAYPESANVYDSYGEALMLRGFYEAARTNYTTNYTKSLDLDPDNENATQMLNRLEQLVR